jgi:hypothetical protein
VTPPGAAGTTIVIVLDGKFCACADTVAATTQPAAINTRSRAVMVSSLAAGSPGFSEIIPPERAKGDFCQAATGDRMRLTTAGTG